MIEGQSVPVETAPAVMNETELRQRIEELGPWFHNMQLHGVWTAPDHFLGNYPEVKFASFREALPADRSGMCVLDIGCIAVFYSF